TGFSAPGPSKQGTPPYKSGLDTYLTPAYALLEVTIS
ncbi:MAG: hypothetical protein ACI9HI_002305, partial [Salinirussus sp.]